MIRWCQTFMCDSLEDLEKRFLRADYRIDCDSREHRAYQIYAAFMILVRRATHGHSLM